MQISYVRLPQSEVLPGIDTREEINAQATIGFFDYWLVYAGARRDLANDQMLQDEFGFGYDDECLGVSLSYRRQYTRDRDIPPSTSVLFRFNLKTGDQTAHATQLFPQHLFSSTEL
jgi:LPS-assembly protein